MLALKIALRYLRARKSHNAVNIISVISVAGVAVATMAIVVVLSVFNGFTDLAQSHLSRIDPELKLEAVDGKVFSGADSLAKRLTALPALAAASPVIRERGLLLSESAQMPVVFQGVDFAAVDSTDMKRNGRRRPNRLALGAEAYNALKNHPAIMERIKYTGTTANPAKVTPQVLAQLFGVEQVKVVESTYNAAGIGQDADMQFICDSKSALLCYATPSPQIDEPSAGYIFTWDMLGNGSAVAFDQFEGEKGTHSEFVEGLMSSDMKKTCDDLALFMHDCV